MRRWKSKKTERKEGRRWRKIGEEGSEE